MYHLQRRKKEILLYRRINKALDWCFRRTKTFSSENKLVIYIYFSQYILCFFTYMCYIYILAHSEVGVGYLKQLLAEFVGVVYILFKIDRSEMSSRSQCCDYTCE